MQSAFTLASSPKPLVPFNQDFQKCVIYVECDNRILTFPGNQENWDLPAGKILKKELPNVAALRILQEKGPFAVNSNALSSHGFRYARSANGEAVTDFIVHFFHLQLSQRPLNLQGASWISTFAYPYLHLIQGNELDLDRKAPEDGRLQVFDVVYQSRIWHTLPNPVAAAASAADLGNKILVLQKGDKRIELNHKRRLLVLILGIAAAGKKTQSLLLNKALGLPSTSTRELLRDDGVRLKNMVKSYESAHRGESVPDELPIGMIASRISQPDCQAGVILRGFPITGEQCRVFLSIFRQNTDLLVPIYFKMTSDIVDRIPNTKREAAEARTKAMKAHENEVTSQLKPHVLDLKGEDSISEVFHQTFQELQKALDSAYAEERRRVALARGRSVEPGQSGDSRASASGTGERYSGASSSRDPESNLDENAPLLRKSANSDKGEEKCCVIQ